MLLGKLQIQNKQVDFWNLVYVIMCPCKEMSWRNCGLMYCSVQCTMSWK